MFVTNSSIASKVLSNLKEINLELTESLQTCRKTDTIDRIVQTLGLLEILSTPGAPYGEELLSATKLVSLTLNKIRSAPNLARRTNVISDGDENPCDFSLLHQHHLVGFADIIGCEKAKQSLKENIILQFDLSDAILSGIRSGAGNVLLHGPPGTGKTLLAQAAAREAGAVLITLKPSDVLSKFHGESEKMMSKIFSYIKSLPRVVLFLDEIDSLATTRASMQDNIQSRRILSELLLQLSGLKEFYEQAYLRTREAVAAKQRRVAVIAATNRIEDIDEALVRRFDCKIFVGVPGKFGRIAMIKKFLRGVDYSITEREFQEIARQTYGWSGSDIETLTREAAMLPLRDINFISGERGIRTITANDFDKSFKTVVIRESDDISDDDR